LAESRGSLTTKAGGRPLRAASTSQHHIGKKVQTTLCSTSLYLLLIYNGRYRCTVGKHRSVFRNSATPERREFSACCPSGQTAIVWGLQVYPGFLDWPLVVLKNAPA
jgi:hypothetical protein